MTTLPENIIEKLIQIEAGIHYFESPEPGQMPFVVIERESPVILSAPHGAMTFRNNHTETWHEEDEYTAGMALLLSEICNTSVIATTWRTEDSDPNEHDEDRSLYKREIRRLAKAAGARWVIDLHGAGEDSPRLFEKQKVELGTGSRDEYLPVEVHKALVAILNKHLGKDAAYRNGRPGFRAEGSNRIAAFSSQALGLHSVQIEMKPSVRVPLRRENSSAYQKGGPYSASPQNVVGMMRSLVEFIGFLNAFTS
ncbi:hypothetical protein JZU46_06285 [bacterium]|nr:hypothetical protein [bacterium]